MTSATALPCSPDLIDPASKWSHPSWMPVIEFPWRIMFGTIVTFAIAVLFPTPPHQLDHRKLVEA